ncbi:MAG: recombinase family protein [Eubacterium sp.]
MNNAGYNPAGALLHKEHYKVAGYNRISREEGDGESNSITVQKQMIEDYVSNHSEMTLVDIYCDDGYTGTNFNRPGFQRMLSDIEEGKIDTVIVKDLSRFGRSYIDAGKYLERIFPEKRIRFIAINDGIDNLTQAYDISMPIKNLINETYARDISNKVQSAFKTKQRHGEFIGAFASYGYMKDLTNHNKLIVDPEAAEVVQWIFSMFLEGYGKIRIAKILNEEGIPCPSEYKKQHGLNYSNSHRLEKTKYWTYSTIHKMLHNEIYTGNMVQNKHYRSMHGKAQKLPESEWIKVENTHEVIIDCDTWDKVQKQLEATTRNINFEMKADINIFAGKIKCGDCGRSMCKSTWKTKEGKKTYFTCGTYRRYGIKECSAHTIKMEVLEEIILNDFNKIVESIHNLKEMIEENTKAVKKSQSSLSSQLAKIESDIQKIQRDKLSSYQDYKDGIISRDDFSEYSKLCEKKLEQSSNRKQLLEEKMTSNNDEIKGYQNSWISNLLETGKVDKLDRDIVVQMIDKIYVYDDKTIKIVYNFSDELKILNVQD